ncbi:MAG: PH domain-containing protein, partial [Clostridia bacterium]|nr:PH domain-containing protein [Clostridia bacterium]
MYLMEGEEIKAGFALVRDVVIFTDRRILDFDKQGATGVKARVNSIYLDSIINVSAETSGFGIDDSSIDIEYITSPYYRANGGVSVSQRTFEFPKKYQIQPLYKWLQEVAYENHLSINK